MTGMGLTYVKLPARRGSIIAEKGNSATERAETTERSRGLKQHVPSPIRLPFRDRIQAGALLGQALQHYAGRDDVLVLALPRGGVPVAFEIVKAIQAPLDLLLVRKLGTPGQEELAMVAIAPGGVRLLNADIVAQLRISDKEIEEIAAREREELERRQRAYRGDRPEPEVRGRCVILVDDGLATGASMRTAIKALRQRQPGRIVVAVPVAPKETIDTLRGEADEVVCLATPAPFWAIGGWYQHFPQTSDAEVKSLLGLAWSTSPQHGVNSERV